MPGRASGSPDVDGAGNTRLLPTESRAGDGVLPQPGQVGEEHLVPTQAGETEVCSHAQHHIIS